MAEHDAGAMSGTGYQPIIIAGREYKLRDQRVGDFAAVQSFVREQRPNPADIFSRLPTQKLPPEMAERLKAACTAEFMAGSASLTTADVVAYYDTFDGLAHRLWLQLKDQHEELATWQDVRELLYQHGMAESLAFDRVLAEMSAKWGPGN